MSHQAGHGPAPGPHGEAPKPLVAQGSGVVPVAEAPPANYPGLAVPDATRSMTMPSIVPGQSHGAQGPAPGPHGEAAKPLVSQSSAPAPSVEPFTAVPQLTGEGDRAPQNPLPSDLQKREAESESAQEKAEDSAAYDNLNKDQQKKLVKVFEEVDKARKTLREKTGSPLVNIAIDVTNFAAKGAGHKDKVVDDFLDQMSNPNSKIWTAIYKPLNSLGANELQGWVKSMQGVVFRFAPADNQSPSFILASGVTLQYVLNDHAWLSQERGSVFTVDDWTPALVEQLVRKAAPELNELTWIELWNPKTNAPEKIHGSLHRDLEAKLPPNGELTYGPQGK